MSDTTAAVQHTLPNGLKIYVEPMHGVGSAAIAFYANTGSRDEYAHEHGVSHFLEHMCFKGGEKFDATELNLAFDELGSIYNAFTSKEHTVYYGWVPGSQILPQGALLADMMRPKLPSEDYETERKVILEEIAMSGDSFDHHVSDFLHQVCFKDHTLAHEILGEQSSIEQMPRDVMIEYVRQRYAPGNMAVFCAGAVEAQQVFDAVEQWCGSWGKDEVRPAPTQDKPRYPRGVHKLKLDRFNQQSIVLIYDAPDASSAHVETIDALTSIVAGPNSRCYWNIQQKGICPQAGAAWLAYRDCGMLAFYADGDPEACEAMHTALKTEIDTLIREGVSEAEVERVKNRRRTHLALEAENPRTRIMQMLEDVETVGQVQTAAARLEAVAKVTPATIAAYLEEYPISGEALTLSVGPRDWP